VRRALVGQLLSCARKQPLAGIDLVIVIVPRASSGAHPGGRGKTKRDTRYNNLEPELILT
jgi:hypothetical protein